jgi:hypothetical protein
MIYRRNFSSTPLAILGGLPTFKDALHVGRPNLGDRQALLARINDMLVTCLQDTEHLKLIGKNIRCFL